MTIEIDESQRQLLILGMALTRLQRPGWEYACREASKKLHGEQMFDQFVLYNSAEHNPATTKEGA